MITDQDQQHLEQNYFDIPNDIKNYITIIIQKEGFTSYNVTATKFAANGDSYLSIVYNAEIKGIKDKEEKTVNLFVKKITDANITIFSIKEIFKRESYLYSELFNIFEELQDNANIPNWDKFKSIKSFYANREAIILEDLSIKGYKTLDRKTVVSFNCAKLVMEQLAKFHGLSIVLEKEKPEYFNKNIKSVETPFELDTEELQLSCENFLFNTKPYLNTAMYKKLEEIFMKSNNKMIKMVTEPKTFFNNVLCHGDCKNANLLYTEMDGVIQDLIIVDYQLIFYGNPLNDFMYFIYLGTDRNFRMKNMENLKNHYYDSLKSFLKYFDLNLDAIFPREKFETQFKDAMYFGLYSAMMCSALIFSDDDYVADLEKTNYANIHVKPDNRVGNRVQEIAEDFIEYTNTYT